MPVQIRAKAPLRLSFAGGGTDVSPFLDREGGCVLSATISRYSWGTLRPREDSQIHLESADLGALFYFDTRSNLVYDGKMDLAKAAIRNLSGQDSLGFDLFLQTDAPPGSGLGSSSSLVVNMIGLLREFKNLPLTEYETAELAFQIERRELGIQGGMQDQYASTFGGFNFIEFHPGRVLVNPLRVNRDSANELEHNLLLCYTGKPRPTDGIIQDQVGRYEHHDESATEALRHQKTLAIEMKNLLLQRKLDDFGALLGAAWETKKKLSPKISNPHIDEMYEEARRHGALGGKITGAGGGGYRGEGFAMPLVEAMACGTPVITTAAGPAVEYCSPETSFLIPAAEVAVPETPPPLGEFSCPWTWFEPDVALLAQTMRRVFESRDSAKSRGLSASQKIHASLAWEKVLPAYHARITALTRSAT